MKAPSVLKALADWLQPKSQSNNNLSASTSNEPTRNSDGELSQSNSIFALITSTAADPTGGTSPEPQLSPTPAASLLAELPFHDTLDPTPEPETTDRDGPAVATPEMVSPMMPPAPTPPVNGNNAASNGPSDRSSGLLNLLKFSGQSQASASTSGHGDAFQSGSSGSMHRQPQGYMHHHFGSGPGSSQNSPLGQPPSYPAANNQPPIMAPAPVTADPSGLLAALMRGHREMDDHQPEDRAMTRVNAAMPSAPDPPSSYGQQNSASETRTYLLNLLNQPKPSQEDQPPSSSLTPQSADQNAARPRVPSGAFEFEQRSQEQVPTYGGYQGPEYGDGRARYGGQSSNMDESFSPTPPQHQPEPQRPGAFQILKKPRSTGVSPAGSGAEPKHHAMAYDSPASTPGQGRGKMEQPMSPDLPVAQKTPTSSESGRHAEKPKETVADAVSDIAEKASEEAREALARAEEEQHQAEIDKDIEDMMQAKTDKEFQEAAKHAALAIKKELDRPEHRSALDDNLPPKVAMEVRKELDEAAGAEVADNWEETADDNDDDAIVVDEEPMIKVYNFPVQPWISITMQENGTEPRPQFRDEAIIDVAKLKKEFDQYDRNLYTATRRYMAYAMSKQGGIHVVRQDDGRDAKIFLNTKERIFNVAMSTTPGEHSGMHREAILGTGVNGNVYWVELFHGDKDHIEETHPEQYGFLLPPLASQDGDTSGGTLKTRARVSSYHPEFFAIGRGKSINVIWPALIMKHDLFVPGTSDRTVDSERLAQVCSLKINTGKAGKDFTFSHDDTVIVSLDKSGRVKFWDVRAMTTAKKGSDPNAPLPAETSIELKEPIMNLPSTLEGEKAWPTSVLLLDKVRPYQKRTALRYMIVGMKQNHTLQLWDLALRKPVQEFNLPHSKESDAMCSVTYHPDSGIIVIGHPTRNSIYLAHLSAPRYTYKNINQADFIIRLDSKDPSLPIPDSTAVMSGVREYTLASHGNLRSLDMLCSPAMAQEDEEPALFELYVMQSKGAICIAVRRDDLGWSKENKVVNGIDAVTAKAITVSTLKPLAEAADESVTKTLGRNGKEVAGHQMLDEGATKKPAAATSTASPVKMQTRNNENASNPSVASVAASSADKNEKKGRKKKNAAQDTHTSGGGPSAASAKTAANAPIKGGLFSDSPKTVPTSQKPAAGPLISQEAIDVTVKNMETRLTSSISSVVESAFQDLSKSFDSRESDFDSRQTKLLQVVSDVLSQNVQGVLSDMIEKQLTTSVIPAVAKATLEQVTAQSVQGIQKELAQSLPSVAEKVMLNPRVISAISQKISGQLTDQLAADVAQRVQDDVVSALQTNLMPPITQMTTRTAHTIADEVQRSMQDEFERLNDERRADAMKVSQLLNLVTRLSDTVSTMAASQTQFQAEILQKLQRQPIADRSQTSAGPSSTRGANFSPQTGISPASNSMLQLTHVPHNQGPPSLPSGSAAQHQHTPQHHHAPQHQHQHQHQHQMQMQQMQMAPTAQQVAGLSETDLEIAEQVHAIDQLVHAQKMEEAIIRWLQSGNSDDIFNRYWSKLSPVYLRDLPPLVLLSIATTVSQQLNDPDLNRCRAKVAWLEVSIHSLHGSYPTYVDDEQVSGVTPNIMKLVLNHAEDLCLRIQRQDNHDPILKNLGSLMAACRVILDHAVSHASAQQSGDHRGHY